MWSLMTGEGRGCVHLSPARYTASVKLTPDADHDGLRSVIQPFHYLLDLHYGNICEPT